MSPRERWGRVHVEADRRRPCGIVGVRRPEPVRLTANQVALRVLAGVLCGILVTLAMTGRPW